MSIAPAIILRELREATGLEWKSARRSWVLASAHLPGTDVIVCLSSACECLWLEGSSDLDELLDDDDRAHLGASVARVLGQWSADITREASERLRLATQLLIAAEGRGGDA